MAAGKIEAVHSEIGERIAEMRSRADRLSPLDIYARMDAIRQAASAHSHDLAESSVEDRASWRCSCARAETKPAAARPR